MRFIVTISDKELEIEAVPSNPGIVVQRGSEAVPVWLEGRPGSKIYTLHVGDQKFKLALMKIGAEYYIHWRGYELPVRIERAVARRYRALLQKAAPQAHRALDVHTITSHMPGLIAQIFVTEGQRVAVGEKLWVLEAMKMENEVRAPIAGVIEKVHIQPGTQVEKGQPICTIRVGEAP
jgi:biotin carboxyl carrier protein